MQFWSISDTFVLKLHCENSPEFKWAVRKLEEGRWNARVEDSEDGKKCLIIISKESFWSLLSKYLIVTKLVNFNDVAELEKIMASIANESGNAVRPHDVQIRGVGSKAFASLVIKINSLDPKDLATKTFGIGPKEGESLPVSGQGYQAIVEIVANQLVLSGDRASIQQIFMQMEKVGLLQSKLSYEAIMQCLQYFSLGIASPFPMKPEDGYEYKFLKRAFVNSWDLDLQYFNEENEAYDYTHIAPEELPDLIKNIYKSKDADLEEDRLQGQLVNLESVETLRLAQYEADVIDSLLSRSADRFINEEDRRLRKMMRYEYLPEWVLESKYKETLVDKELTKAERETLNDERARRAARKASESLDKMHQASLLREAVKIFTKSWVKAIEEQVEQVELAEKMKERARRFKERVEKREKERVLKQPASAHKIIGVYTGHEVDPVNETLGWEHYVSQGEYKGSRRTPVDNYNMLPAEDPATGNFERFSPETWELVKQASNPYFRCRFRFPNGVAINSL